MKKGIMLSFALLLLTGCSYFSGETNELRVEGDVEHTIVATASTTTGQIIEMRKGLGEMVKKGDIIAVIDYENQQFSIKQLEAAVQIKEAALEKLSKGARTEQIEQAKATVKVAEAKLAEIKAGTRPEQIEQAMAQVKVAKAQLDLVQSGARTEQIEQAKNSVLIAKEAYQTQHISYEQIHKTYENTRQLFESGLTPQKELDVAKTQLDLANTQLTALQLQVDNAIQQLNLLENRTVAEEITIAQANYEAAQAQLALLKKGATSQAIAAGAAEVEKAKAQLALVTNSTVEQDILIAQAEVESTKAQLEGAQNQLQRHFIKALTDGRIISKSVELGNVVTAGSHVADIASSEPTIVIYVPTELIHTISYDQKLTVHTPTGETTGSVSYIALEDEYMPKDKQTGDEKKPIATKVKITLQEQTQALNPSTPVEVSIPLQ